MPPPKAPAGPFDARLVRQLADILNETGLSEIEVEREGMKVRVARLAAAPAQIQVAPPPTTFAVAASAAPAPAAPEAVSGGDLVRSPMVGTVYLRPQPEAPVFASVGDEVSEGQTLLLVEAMKTMNPITAPRAGKVLEILVADAQPVEYGEPLVVLG